mgnify:CR=1 FL=1
MNDFEAYYWRVSDLATVNATAGEPLRRDAHVVWRKEKRIGITFVEAASYIRLARRSIT